MNAWDTRPGTVCECGNHAFAPITRGYVALVSPEDISLFNYKWQADVNARTTRVGVRRTGPRPERAHQHISRQICYAEPGQVVDHINRNPLDNQRENLRACSHQQNTWNSVGQRRSPLPKGVDKNEGRFRARIQLGGKYRYIGNFATIEEATAAYIAEAKKHRGEYARW